MVKLIYGEETYLAQQAYTKAKNNYEYPKVFTDFDMGAYEACSQNTLFDVGQRGVFVRLEQLTKNELLESYLEHPVSTCDLFVYADKVNTNLKVFKAFKDNVECYKKVSAEKLRNYIVGYLKKKDAVITEDAYRLFVERMGYMQKDSGVTLWDVFNELSKLAVLTSQITKEVVEAEVSSLYANAFELTSYYVNHDYVKLLTAIDTLSIEKGFSSIQTLSLLFWNWRNMYRTVVLGMPAAYGQSFRVRMEQKDIVEGMKLIADGIRLGKSGQYNDKNGLKIVALQLIALAS